MLMVCAIGAVAAQVVDERIEASPSASVEVENLSGSVVVEGWERAEVHVTGTLGVDTDGLVLKGGPDRVLVEVKIPDNHGRRHRHADYDSRIQVFVPRGCELEVETVSADIEASELDGLVSMESVSGELELRADAAEAELESVSGNVRAFGSIGRLEAESVSGDVELRDVRGQLSASSVSGSIKVEAGIVDRVSLETVSGNVHFSGDLVPGARLDAESHSGNVELQLPEGSAFDYRLSTFSGNIDNVFGPAPKDTDYVPTRRLEFSTDHGGARVEVETFSGDILLTER
jgi:DUF4097 and DUF4098 domain-containing protein YvlB